MTPAEKKAADAKRAAKREVRYKTPSPRDGRPVVQIDWKAFDGYCKLQATLEEIAGFFDCSIDTVENAVKEKWGVTFSEYLRQKSSHGKLSLRRAQWKKAQEGNPTMLIWLGKNVLGQRDSFDVNTNHSGQVDANLQIDLAKLSEAELRQWLALSEKVQTDGTVTQLLPAGAALPVASVKQADTK